MNIASDLANLFTQYSRLSIMTGKNQELGNQVELR